MMEVVAGILVWLNSAANVFGRILLAPIAVLPGWLSATLVAAVTGVLLLVIFKYTSNQVAIKRVRDEINANLLALKLFKDSARVAIVSQGRVFGGAFKLMVLALVPILVMALPVCLVLGQLSLWYQLRPLQVGEQAVITLSLNQSQSPSWPSVSLAPSTAIEVVTGPVRVLSKREVCWDVKALQQGSHRLDFQVGDQTAAKEFAIGDGFMRVSKLRPGWHFTDILENPGEPPFRPDSPVQSIDIDYPARSSWNSGTNWWVIYWFVVSFIAAFCFHRPLKVNV